MEKKPKKELIEIIEDQENKILTYRHKLRDVIEAYKGVTKEKEALEKSLKAINLSESNITQENVKETSQNDGEATSINDGNSNDAISTLKEAIGTLTNEKIRIENCLNAEKKKLKRESEYLQQQIEDLKNQHKSEIQKLNQTIEEHKWNLGGEQKQREEENKNSALMMRELQSLLTNERNSNDRFVKQVDKLKKQNENGCKLFEKQLADYRKTVLELETELNRVREKLASSETDILKPSPLLVELKREMTDMKMDHQHAVVEEQRRVNEAEEKLKSLAQGSEERVTTLELKVAELSEMIGNYDRVRYQDQQAIVKLKDRVAQLDLENMILAQAANGIGLELEASKLDPQMLIDKIIKLKNLLKIANERSEFPVDLGEVFGVNNALPESDIHAHCHEEMEAIRTEYEHYKARAQTVLKSKSAKDQDYSKEHETLYNQISELKNKLKILKSQSDTGEEYREQVINKLQNTLQDLKLKHRREIGQIEANHASKLVELEQQMQKQRERTLALLREKDKEIQNVKDSLLSHPLFQGSFQLQDSSNQSKNSDNSESEGESSTKRDTVAEMLSKTMASKKGEQKILHYVQEIARKDVEISNLRRGRHLLESTLRESQCLAAAKEEKYVEEIELLSKKVSRLESSQNEKGVNMEYLKNVVLRFVLCKDLAGKRHMLNAIAAILHFTAKELEEAKLNC